MMNAGAGVRDAHQHPLISTATHLRRLHGKCPHGFRGAGNANRADKISAFDNGSSRFGRSGYRSFMEVCGNSHGCGGEKGQDGNAQSLA